MTKHPPTDPRYYVSEKMERRIAEKLRRSDSEREQLAGDLAIRRYKIAIGLLKGANK